MPSSVSVWKKYWAVYRGVSLPVQRTVKLSTGQVPSLGNGDPLPKETSTLASTRMFDGVPVRVRFLKYWPLRPPQTALKHLLGLAQSGSPAPLGRQPEPSHW